MALTDRRKCQVDSVVPNQRVQPRLSRAPRPTSIAAAKPLKREAHIKIFFYPLSFSSSLPILFLLLPLGCFVKKAFAMKAGNSLLLPPR